MMMMMMNEELAKNIMHVINISAPFAFHNKISTYKLPVLVMLEFTLNPLVRGDC